MSLRKNYGIEENQLLAAETKDTSTEYSHSKTTFFSPVPEKNVSIKSSKNANLESTPGSAKIRI